MVSSVLTRCISNQRSILFLLLALALAALGCGKGDKELPPGASAESEIGRPLSDVELPVSLRMSDAQPTDAYQIEATTEQLRLEGKPVLALDGKGNVDAKDKVDGVIPKLQSALGAARHSTIAMRLQANIPYETIALVLNTATKVGTFNAAFAVHQSGQSNKTGWLDFDGFIMSSKADDVPAFTSVKQQSWDVFAEKWQETFDGCRTSPGGNCAYLPGNIAKGGTLKVELFASGRGINVDFYRRGLTPEQERAEEEKRHRELAAKKEDFLQGRITHDQMVEILLLGDPSTQALFQFRYIEGLKGPSALQKTIDPVCGSGAKERCGVVIAADAIAPLVRVASMVGAAFPDGTKMPAFAFEMPWTKAPKPYIPEWAADKITID
jgi:hypothetical protein